jgi:HrpA-like RNA helicase
VILATNVAETSLTIDGIGAVVDCDLTKVMCYNSRVYMEVLRVAPISKAQAKQRARRARRTRPGRCFRLYTPETYDGLAVTTLPAVQRERMTDAVPKLKAAGHNDIFRHFPWLISPAPDALLRMSEELTVM